MNDTPFARVIKTSADGHCGSAYSSLPMLELWRVDWKGDGRQGPQRREAFYQPLRAGDAIYDLTLARAMGARP